jgi:hypothetical protein
MLILLKKDEIQNELGKFVIVNESLKNVIDNICNYYENKIINISLMND